MRARCLIGCLLLLMLAGCGDGPQMGSSVPNAPVQLSVNTATGIYVHFIPANWGECLIVDAEGYHYRGQTLPCTKLDYWGYRGVVVYVNMNNRYGAFDLCCPHCPYMPSRLEIKGSRAVCPLCGEEYSLDDDIAWPLNGISNEPLRKYQTTYSGDKLTIYSSPY